MLFISAGNITSDLIADQYSMKLAICAMMAIDVICLIILAIAIYWIYKFNYYHTVQYTLRGRINAIAIYVVILSILLLSNLAIEVYVNRTFDNLSETTEQYFENINIANTNIQNINILNVNNNNIYTFLNDMIAAYNKSTSIYFNNFVISLKNTDVALLQPWYKLNITDENLNAILVLCTLASEANISPVSLLQNIYDIYGITNTTSILNIQSILLKNELLLHPTLSQIIDYIKTNNINLLQLTQYIQVWSTSASTQLQTNINLLSKNIYPPLCKYFSHMNI